jgi:hypothetical protein
MQYNHKGNASRTNERSSKTITLEGSSLSAPGSAQRLDKSVVALQISHDPIMIIYSVL